MRRPATVLAFTAALALAGLATATEASAHVGVTSSNATQGAESVLTFRVPTESDTASTIGLAIQLPQDTPLAEVEVQPKAGWTFTVKMVTLAKPITTDDGTVTQAVSEVDWKATSVAAGIKPGEFDLFSINAGPLPDTSTITFKAIQTYSDNTTVAWIELPAPGSTAEPEHPAPVLALAPAAGASTAPTASSSTAPTVTATTTKKASNAAGITGIGLGGVGILLGAAALVVALRRRPTA